MAACSRADSFHGIAGNIDGSVESECDFSSFYIIVNCLWKSYYVDSFL